MRKFAAVVLAGLGICVIGVRAQDGEKVARGKYLVEEIARCQECHAPKLDNGEYVKSAWMKGTMLSFGSTTQLTGWHSKSPDITSTSALWARWGEDGMVKFFETGKNPRGSKAGPPMPAYSMKHEDAEAVVAFLKTLP